MTPENSVKFKCVSISHVVLTVYVYPSVTLSVTVYVCPLVTLS